MTTRSPRPSSPTYSPMPGAAPLPRMLSRQTGLELRLQLRNGEQLLLTVVIPTLLLVLFSTVDVVDVGEGSRIDFVTPGILGLAVLSTAFTGQAIATGFDRRYGVLKRLAATPLPRWGLIASKTGCVLVIEAVQVVLICAVAFALGWSPNGNPAAVIVLLLLGTAAFSGLGLLVGGTLRAEATLAVANLVYLLLLLGGGVFLPIDRFPQGMQTVLELLPMAALTDGLRSVLQDGSALPADSVAVLLVWAVLGLGAAALTFRWE